MLFLLSLGVNLILFGLVYYYVMRNPTKIGQAPFLILSVGMIGIVLTLVILGIVTLPVTLTLAVFPTILGALPFAYTAMKFLRGRWNPVEIKSIVFEATSSISIMLDPSRMTDYPVPYSTAVSYLQEVPIELYNRCDRDLTVWAI